LVGTPDICLETLAGLQAIGVDEIACLIDFGVAIDATLRSLEKLSDLERAYNAAAMPAVERSVSRTSDPHHLKRQA
jgi:hypothetical protein